MKRIDIFLILVFLVFISCGDESPRQTIPYAPVNFGINLHSYDNELSIPNSYKLFTEEQRRLPSDRFGYGGVLVVSGATAGEFHAFDLCCPYEDNRQVLVNPDYEGKGYNGKVKCPSCGSVFVTLFGLGNVESGPSGESLQRYTVLPLPDGTYRVVN